MEIRNVWRNLGFASVRQRDCVHSFGSGDNLDAVSVNTGEFLWGLWAYASIQASPVVSDGVVYVGSFDGYPYNLFALNARTGDILWQYETTTGQTKERGL